MDKRREWSSLWYFDSMVLQIFGNYFAISLLQVNHSQRMNEKLLTPWVVAEPNGKILCAHCDHKAGLGKCCSHVASLLWAVEAGVRILGKKRCLTSFQTLQYQSGSSSSPLPCTATYHYCILATFTWSVTFLTYLLCLTCTNVNISLYCNYFACSNTCIYWSHVLPTFSILLIIIITKIFSLLFVSIYCYCHKNIYIYMAG